MRTRLLAVSTLTAALLLPSPASAQRGQRTGDALTDRMFEAIGVKEGLTVCEIGAGDGSLSVQVARLVGERGRVFTSELGEERVKQLQKAVADSGRSWITVVTGDPVKTNFPDSACDAAFMRNVYHHFAEPVTMNASILAALKPGAKLAVVDFAPPNEEAPTPAERAKDGMHGVTPESVYSEMKTAGLEAVTTGPARSELKGAERWYLVVVARPAR